MLDQNMIKAQSTAAYKQWAPQWREHAKIHSKFRMKGLEEIEHSGVGKALLLAANGYSLEENISTIKKYQKNVDIMCCDKSLGSLLDHGIKPKYVLIADANVDYEKYLKPYLNDLSETTAIVNVCANPKWTDGVKWKDMFFFVVKDILGSEQEFCGITGCKNVVMAGTNVSNSMIIMATQCDNGKKRNFLGYDKLLLIGYDYSWRPDGKYYAFDDDGDGKSGYMKHLYVVLQSGKFGYTSGNLAFSCKWIEDYLRAFQIPAVQCSKDTVMGSVRFSTLEEQMQYKSDTSHAKLVKEKASLVRTLHKELNSLMTELNMIERQHKFDFLRTV